jgi:DNA-binding response OmpR family regulator
LKTTIGYVDDREDNLECISLILNQEFEVKAYPDPDLFLYDLPRSSYTAILIDIHMPKMDGFALYEKILEQEHYNGCPIIFISSDDSDSNRINSFTIGAVDFINRQTGPAELLARVKSKIEFFKKHRSIIEFSNLKVNLTLLKAYIDNKELGLTFIEFKILYHVLRNYPNYVTKEQIVEYVWNSPHVLDPTIYTHVSNLNGKLGAWDYQVLGVKNKGIIITKKEPGK